MNKQYLFAFYSLFFFAFACKKNKSNINFEKFYTLQQVRVSNDVIKKISEYKSTINIEDSNKYPIVLCKYFKSDNINFVSIGLFEKHEYFFYEQGFAKNVFCLANDTIPIILEVDKNLMNNRKYGIFEVDEYCAFEFPNSWGFTFLTKDSIIPKVVKDNVDKTKEGWINYHTKADRWLFKLSQKGNVIETSLEVKEGGVPILTIRE